MKKIHELQRRALLQRVNPASWSDFVDWAIERLRKDEEGDDLDVVMLAAATREDEAVALTMLILERYRGAVTDGLLVGKHVVEMFDALRAGRESCVSLEPRLWRLYYDHGQPHWLAQLARNCEYATDMQEFEKPFLDELEYIARLWRNAESEAQFSALYDPAVSRSHDAI